MKATTVIGIAWIMVGIAVGIAIYISKSCTPLWAMLIPTFLSTSSSNIK